MADLLLKFSGCANNCVWNPEKYLTKLTLAPTRRAVDCTAGHRRICYVRFISQFDWSTRSAVVPFFGMPKEFQKRGRREEKKRKRKQEIEYKSSKQRKFEEPDEGVEIILDHGGSLLETDHSNSYGPRDVPFYGMLDEEEQEYFKRADSMLELDQFPSSADRELFLANVFEEANGKELKIANSQSCSRLMERLIVKSLPSQLKALFHQFRGQYVRRTPRY